METTKICNKCNIEKELTEFSYRNDRKKYKNECKKCWNAQTKENYNKQKNNEEFIIKRREYARKYYHKNTEKIKAYQEKNKDRIVEYKKEYRAKNHSEIRRKEKEYYHNNKEKKREYQEKNKDRIRAKRREYYLNNKDMFKEKWQEYRKTEKGKMVFKNSNNKRRAKMREGNIKTEDLQLLIQNSKFCYWCGTKLNKDYHIDHYKALSNGGTHTIDNLVISCSSCNLSKGTRDPLEFALTKGKLF